jgi:hypothetical protein
MQALFYFLNITAMKKIYLFILVFINTLNIANAQWQWTGGPPGGGMYCITVKDSIIFVGSMGNGVYKSTDDGITWTAASTGLYYVSGHYVGVYALAVKGNNIFAGTYNFGVYVSSDNGANWSAVNNGITDLMITSFTVHDSMIYTGTRNGGGVFRSADNGANWTAVNNGITNTYIRSLAASDSNIYAGTSWWDGRAYRSNDNGANWITINNGLCDTDIIALAVHGNDMFAGTKGMGVYHSNDNGTSWVVANNGMNDFIAVWAFAFYGSNIIAGVNTTNNYGGIYLSKDNGANWSLWNDGMSPGSYNILGLAIHNGYIFAATGGNGVWRRKLSDLTGIAEIGDNSKISIFPNPAHDWIILEPSKSLTEAAELQLYNILGKKVLSQTLNPLQEKYNVDVSGLAEGMYIIKVLEKGSTLFNGKLVVQ